MTRADGADEDALTSSQETLMTWMPPLSSRYSN